MNVIIKDIKEAECACDALVLTLCEGEKADVYGETDASLKGLLSHVISTKEFEGKQNQLCLLHSMNSAGPERVLLAGLGKKEEITPERVRQAGGKAVSYLFGLGVKDIALSSAHLLPLGQSPMPFIEGGLLSLYRFRKYKKDKENAEGLERFTIVGKPDKTLFEAAGSVVATVSAVNLARDLVNTPSNDMTPAVLAKTAKGIARGKVSLKVLERSDAEKEGMGAYLSVARGSHEPPKFIVLRYEGVKGVPVALVGKSITFDSGGISIKPGEGMEKMKYDMAGGAVVLAVIKAAAEMRLPAHLLGVLPAAENLPGGGASKPGDVVSTTAGKTVEIISTDAEGRLALADAIAYVKKFRPAVIIDIATLTGACGVALGNEAIAMMGNDEATMERLEAAGDAVYERVWKMPLYDEYLEYIKSDVADLKNSGGRSGSLVTAGYFLKEFVGETPWVHLDIAGTAWTEKDRPYMTKGATGFGVRLLLNFLGR
ncbi:MAG: leucyl aminopeptidase [Nitrospirae bacterium]|nr:leucyl aminopeptidase [Nitrospirota bacterium]